MKNDESKGLSWPLSLLVTLLICVLAYTAASLLTREKSHILSDTTVLPCTSSQAVQVLGKGVVYSDGTSLRALNDRGRQTWSYVVGANCGFNACESGVAAWSGDLLAVLNPENGAAPVDLSQFPDCHILLYLVISFSFPQFFPCEVAREE